MSQSLSRAKILIANRGEIACRILQSAHEMGLHTVCVFVKGDESARHLTYAQEIYEISSYLSIDEIIRVARESSATLVHPGYGFLSERVAFVEACEKNGLRFCGPSAQSMRMMGGKIEAKASAKSAGVPVLPWAKISLGDASLSETAKAIGYPLLVKASAGGGGKGMRKVEKPEDLMECAQMASSEAQASFGEGTLFLEKFLKNPRHIEVQVFGDGTGEGFHLFERDCSLQRRNQKIWEEAPALHLSDNTRAALFEASLRLVKAVQYCSAGTLEFLVDANERIYFLEMNTRLQVEHTVSEEISGVDLVRMQIELALDKPYSEIRKAFTPRGHSIEVRIVAEDPTKNFMPAVGTCARIKFPTGAGIRVESGIEEGQKINGAFDSMVAKLIVTATTREACLQRLQWALSQTIILGFRNNLNFLRWLGQQPEVTQAHTHIHLLEEMVERFKVFFREKIEAEKAALFAISQFSCGSRSRILDASDKPARETDSPWQK